MYKEGERTLKMNWKELLHGKYILTNQRTDRSTETIDNLENTQTPKYCNKYYYLGIYHKPWKV